MSPLRPEKLCVNGKARKKLPNEHRKKQGIVEGQFDDAIEQPRFEERPVHRTGSRCQPFYQPGRSNPIQITKVTPETLARSMGPGVPRAYLNGVTIPSLRPSPQTHLQPKLAEGTAVVGNASYYSVGTSQNTLYGTGLSTLRIPQPYCGPRLPQARSTPTRVDLHSPSTDRTNHDSTYGNRNVLPSSSIPQPHQATCLPKKRPRTSQDTDARLPTNSGPSNNSQKTNPSTSNHEPEPDSAQSSIPIPLEQSNQNQPQVQSTATSRQYVPLAPRWSPLLFPFGIPMPPPNPSRVVPNVDTPSTPFQRALNRTGAQLASRNARTKVPEDKEKKFGVADKELTSADVLYGRGGWTNTNPGNVFFRALVDEYRMEYAMAGRGTKTGVSEKIVDLIRNNQGRFLKKDEDDDLWFEVGDQKAIEKTGQTLREGMAKVVRESLVSHVAARVTNENFCFATSTAENSQETNQQQTKRQRI